MQIHTLKINIAQLTKEINKHYFKYRDIFYKALIINLCINKWSNGSIIENTIIEDSQYNQYFLYLYNKNLGLRELLSELNISNALFIYLDLSIYLDEFVQLKHSNNNINIYSLTIENGYILICNKKLDFQNRF